MLLHSAVARPIDERLQWSSQLGGDVLHALGVRPQKRVRVTYVFATVRRMLDGNGLLQGNGYAVARGTFDDLREFRTLEEAKLYVESIYELERG